MYFVKRDLDRFLLCFFKTVVVIRAEQHLTVITYVYNMQFFSPDLFLNFDNFHKDCDFSVNIGQLVPKGLESYRWAMYDIYVSKNVLTYLRMKFRYDQ